MRKLTYSLSLISLLIVGGAGVLYLYLAPSTAPDSVIATSTLTHTNAGEVVGFINNGVQTWLGIPYAAPPIGDLRWRAPRVAP